MIEKINPWVEGKKVLILGFGREGQSTWHLLRRLGTCACLDVADQAAFHPQTGEGEQEEGTRWICGPDYQKCMDQYDVVFKSPGIVLEKPLQEYRCQILSQTEVFFQLFRDQTAGITGTKGKSTVTSLLYHVLKSSGRKSLLAGNIGIPAFDHIEEVEPDTVVVFELSCHQLEYMTVSPHWGVLVNIYEEHLDHYGTMERYVHAKENIFRNQKPEDILICSTQCLPEPGACPSLLIPAGEDVREDAGGIRLTYGPKGEPAVEFRGERYPIPAGEIRLMGHHNYFDIGVVYGLCRLMGVTREEFDQALRSYEPLPHRLQYLGQKDGVKYYDDSISTICATTIQALNTLADADTVLIGGMDRGIDYRELIDFLAVHPVPHIILMEATGKRIYQEILTEHPDFPGKERLMLVPHLKDGVEAAKKVTRAGRSCVLSPAAASYGIFKNFEERGLAFGRYVFETK